jgi:hypothetical protein
MCVCALMLPSCRAVGAGLYTRSDMLAMLSIKVV